MLRALERLSKGDEVFRASLGNTVMPLSPPHHCRENSNLIVLDPERHFLHVFPDIVYFPSFQDNPKFGSFITERQLLVSQPS